MAFASLVQGLHQHPNNYQGTDACILCCAKTFPSRRCAWPGRDSAQLCACLPDLFCCYFKANPCWGICHTSTKLMSQMSLRMPMPKSYLHVGTLGGQP